MLIDVSFLALVAAAAAREILAGSNWRNLNVVVLVLLLLAGNVAFHGIDAQQQAFLRSAVAFGAQRTWSRLLLARTW
jgi:uncharacterized protein involved in response to NO